MLRILRSPIMTWKIFYLLVLISTLDFPPKIRANDEPIEPRAEFFKRDDGRKSLPEVHSSTDVHDDPYFDDDYRRPSKQKQVEEREEERPRPYNREAEAAFRRRPYERENEYPALIGKWRNNGEALEPEWRDGDSMPLFPFAHLESSQSKDDKDNTDYESPEDDSIAETHYHVPTNRQTRPRPNTDKSLPKSDEYEAEISTRNNKQDLDPERAGNNNLKTTLNAAKTFDDSSGANRNRSQGSKTKMTKEQGISMRYKEAFQMPSNAYEQELIDEEYLKPRPRKRRPPQNYEFALAANEAATRQRNSTPRPLMHLIEQGDSSSAIAVDTQRKKNVLRGKLSENALELKSLLKMQQEENLSLSEILQRKNLTLHDLLRGKVDIIGLLKSKEVDETLEDIEEVSKAMSDSLMKLPANESSQGVTTTSAAATSTTTTTQQTTTLPEEFNKSETQYRVRVLFTESKVTKQTASSQLESTTPISSRETTSTKPSDSNDMESGGLSQNGESALATKTVLVTLKPSWTDIRGTTKTFLTNSPATITEPFVDEYSKTQSNNTDNDNPDEDEIMEFSDFPGFNKVKSGSMTAGWADVNVNQKTVDFTERQDDDRDAGSTLSNEYILNPTEQTITHKNNENNVQNKQSAFINEFFGNDYGEFFEYQNDSPGEDLGENTHVENVTGVPNTSEVKSSTGNHRSEASNSKIYENILTEVEPEARAEIFELFTSSSSSKRLERLLKSRNMSIEELIALRQRGSSKVHLAEISRLREQAPKPLKTEDKDSSDKQLETKDSKSERMIENHSNVDNRVEDQVRQNPDKFKTETFFDTITKDDSMLKLFDLFHARRSTENPDVVTLLTKEQRENNELEIKDNTNNKVEIRDLLTTFASLPFGKDEPFVNSATDYLDHDNPGVTKLPNDDEIRVLFPKNVDNSKESRSHILDATQGEFDEDINKVQLSMNMETIYGTSQNENDINIPSNEKKFSRMKPSIIASGAILGVTLVVFLAILIVCRMRQKQKYTYSNTFSRAVFQGPMMAARKLSDSSTLSTVMVNVVSTSTAERSNRNDALDGPDEFEFKTDIDNDSLDANDSWESIPNYLK